MPQYIAAVINPSVHILVSSKLISWTFVLDFCQLIGPGLISRTFFNLVSVSPLNLFLIVWDWFKIQLVIVLLHFTEIFNCLKVNRWQIKTIQEQVTFWKVSEWRVSALDGCCKSRIFPQMRWCSNAKAITVKRSKRSEVTHCFHTQFWRVNILSKFAKREVQKLQWERESCT